MHDQLRIRSQHGHASVLVSLDEFAIRRLPHAEAAVACGMLQHKADGAVEIMLKAFAAFSNDHQ